MRCPFCSHLEDHVIDSRASSDGAVIRRRRACEGCGKRFTTYERVEEVLPTVVKKDGRREPFDRQKLARAARVACAKRPVETDQIEAMLDGIERSVQESERREVRSAEIGEKLMEGLRSLDAVAFVRFASVYRSFADVGAFQREIESFQAPSQPPDSPSQPPEAPSASPAPGDDHLTKPPLS